MVSSAKLIHPNFVESYTGTWKKPIQGDDLGDFFSNRYSSYKGFAEALWDYLKSTQESPEKRSIPGLIEYAYKCSYFEGDKEKFIELNEKMLGIKLSS